MSDLTYGNIIKIICLNLSAIIEHFVNIFKDTIEFPYDSSENKNQNNRKNKILHLKDKQLKAWTQLAVDTGLRYSFLKRFISLYRQNLTQAVVNLKTKIKQRKTRSAKHTITWQGKIQTDQEKKKKKKKAHRPEHE